MVPPYNANYGDIKRLGKHFNNPSWRRPSPPLRTKEPNKNKECNRGGWRLRYRGTWALRPFNLIPKIHSFIERHVISRLLFHFIFYYFSKAIKTIQDTVQRTVQITIGTILMCNDSNVKIYVHFCREDRLFMGLKLQIILQAVNQSCFVAMPMKKALPYKDR